MGHGFGPRIFRIESQANGVTGLFNFRFHQLEFSATARALLDTRGTRHLDFAAGAFNGARRFFGTGAFFAARRFRKLFIYGHHVKDSLDHLKLAVPTDKGVTFMFRSFGSNRGGTVFHPQGILNHRLFIFPERNRILDLGRIVNSDIFHIARHLREFGRPADKRIIVFRRRFTLQLNHRRLHGFVIIHRVRIDGRSVIVNEGNPELERFIHGIHIQILADLGIGGIVPTNKLIACTQG